MERFSEKDWHKNLSDFRHCKSRMVWGEWIVIIGIAVEIVVAIFSATDAWQANPLNRPIVSATADVEFFILRTNSLQGWQPPKSEVESDLDKMSVRLMFKDPDVGDFPVFLECERIQKMGLGDASGYLIRLDFKSNSLGSQWRTEKQSKKWDNFSVKKFDEFKEADISIDGLSDKAEIGMGSCSVTLNSTIERNFSIDSRSSKDKIILHANNRNSN